MLEVLIIKALTVIGTEIKQTSYGFYRATIVNHDIRILKSVLFDNNVLFDLLCSVEG